MSAEADFVTLMKATSAVTALIGSGNSARIAADRIEQGVVRPFIVYTRGATDDFQSLDGTIHDSKVTLEVQIWADTRSSAEAVADAVQTAVRGGNQTVSGRVGGYDGELDLEAAVLTVEWWA